MNLVIGLILLFLLLQGIKQFGAHGRRQPRRGSCATAAASLGMIGALLLVLRGRVGLAAALASMVANFAGWRTPARARRRFATSARAHARGAPRPRARR